MSEMVERIAKAMHDASVAEFKAFVAKEGRLDLLVAKVWQFTTRSWDETTEITRESERVKARAAIEAMREPTEGMVDAGWKRGLLGWGEGEECEPVWKAMIDEALR